MGLKEEILAQEDLATIEVEVPEWGGRKVRVHAMSASERDEFELGTHREALAAKAENRTPRDVRARYLVCCIVDEAGARVFTEADIPALGRKSAKVLDRLYDEALKLNGYSQKDAQTLEAAAKKD